MPRTPTDRPESESAAPAAVEPFVRALGTDCAIKLFLAFGGSVLYLSERPRVGARLLDVVGLDGVKALARQFGPGHVPLANAWIARRLDGEGVPQAEIARRLRVSRDRLRRYLADESERSARVVEAIASASVWGRGA